MADSRCFVSLVAHFDANPGALDITLGDDELAALDKDFPPTGGGAPESSAKSGVRHGGRRSCRRRRCE